MLVLTRKKLEKIIIGGGITLIVQRITPTTVTLAIEAPKDVRIVRGEIEQEPKK